MNATDWNTALFEKMSDEQDKFRDWLKSQPPEEILHHTYEYTVREDIVMAMEELELTDAQAQALLDSPTPLADVYRYFEKLETGHMDVIRDSIENRADDVCRAKEELRTTPIYPHSAAYVKRWTGWNVCPSRLPSSAATMKTMTRWNDIRWTIGTVARYTVFVLMCCT